MSLTYRIWLLMTLPFVVAFLSYLAVTRPFRRDLLMSEAARDARDDLVVLRNALRGRLIDETEQLADLTALTEALADPERVIGVAVFDGNGTVLTASKRLVGEAPIADLARRAIRTGSEVREVISFHGTTALRHAVLLDPRAAVAGAIIVKDIRHIDDLVAGWTSKLVWVGVGFGLLLTVLAGPLVRVVVSKPLEAMMHGVETVASGQLDVRIPDQRSDEFGRLARAFNTMTANLREERARADHEASGRAALEARMRRLQTLAAAGEVVASLAHEIGTPLGTILGRTRMMAGRADTSENTRRDLEIVAEQTERITRVVKRLLDLSRPRSRESEPAADVGGSLDEVLAFLAPECRRRGIAVRTEREGGPLLVRGGRDRLFQVFFNLVHNALQIQSQGGAIEVHVAHATLRGEPAVRVEIADRGPGIAPDLASRLFEAFVTTREQEGGTGLGLAIVDGLVRELDGTITAQNRPTGGAVFTCTLPVVTAARSIPEPIAVQGDAKGVHA